jgi:hypothetical protein
LVVRSTIAKRVHDTIHLQAGDVVYTDTIHLQAGDVVYTDVDKQGGGIVEFAGKAGQASGFHPC